MTKQDFLLYLTELPPKYWPPGITPRKVKAAEKQLLSDWELWADIKGHLSNRSPEELQLADSFVWDHMIGNVMSRLWHLLGGT